MKKLLITLIITLASISCSIEPVDTLPEPNPQIEIKYHLCESVINWYGETLRNLYVDFIITNTSDQLYKNVYVYFVYNNIVMESSNGEAGYWLYPYKYEQGATYWYYIHGTIDPNLLNFDHITVNGKSYTNIKAERVGL